MYGMVNQAIKQMVLEKHDEATWNVIVNKAKLDVHDFSPYYQYKDEITGTLILTIADHIQVQPQELLESFGEYWIEFARKSEYGLIFDSFASSPVSLIESLNTLHSRTELLFPHLNPPKFSVDHISDGHILVHYSSERDLPLEHFVIGLMKGIFKLFNQPCSVEWLPGTGDVRATFRIKF